MTRPAQIAKHAAKTLVNEIAARVGPHRWPAREPRLWVLMYHRVIPAEQAAREGEEPGMYVTPETFARHLGWMREQFEIVQLGDWVTRASAGAPLPARACAVTFDDGWRDNYEHAFPLLKQTQTPATIFAVSHLVGTARQFWPNRLSRLLGQIATAPANARPAGAAWLLELANGALPAPADSAGIAALIHACKTLPDAEINRRLDALEAELPGMDVAPQLLDWAQLREMQASGLVDVGSHTCHHYRLRADLPEAVALAEIADSQALLKKELGSAVDLFCYPNGDYTDRTAAAVAERYRAAVTTQRGINRRSQPLNRLARIGMHEDVSNTRSRFLARVSTWR